MMPPASRLFVHNFLVFCLVAPVAAFDGNTKLISRGVRVTAAVQLAICPANGLFGWLYDAIGAEYCGSIWLKNDIYGLNYDLRHKLHGQHLVIENVVSLIEGHVRTENPPKALVLSFHGPSGVGKNFVSGIIRDNLLEKKIKSSFFVLRIGTRHYTNSAYSNKYRTSIRELVMEQVKKCARSIFVFDEIEKVPDGVMDVLKPFLDHHPEIDGVDYRKAIFIFLSNIGGGNIMKIALEQRKKGIAREDMRLETFEAAIRTATFESVGGLKHAWVIDHNLVSAYIPFLPLEMEHVKLCIRDYVRENGFRLTESQMTAVANEFVYNDMFSATGCKGVFEKVTRVTPSRRDEL